MTGFFANPAETGQKIKKQLMGLNAVLSQSTEGENFPATRLIAPLIANLKDFLSQQGLDAFLFLMEECFSRLDSLLMQEVVIALMSASAQEDLCRAQEDVLDRHLPFFVTISVRPAQRVLDRVCQLAENSPSGKVVVFQNLRMGGLYPPFEMDLREYLRGIGFPVFAAPLQTMISPGMSDDRVLAAAQEIKSREEYAAARIVLARFKISSAPDPADSRHPEDYFSLASQQEKITALHALAGLQIVPGQGARLDAPVLMVDASKNKLSLAQINVMSPFVEKINALDIMALPFFYHHLYWLSAYGLDNIAALLPASAPGFCEGALYQKFARALTVKLAS